MYNPKGWKISTEVWYLAYFDVIQIPSLLWCFSLMQECTTISLMDCSQFPIVSWFGPVFLLPFPGVHHSLTLPSAPPSNIVSPHPILPSSLELSMFLDALLVLSSCILPFFPSIGCNSLSPSSTSSRVQSLLVEEL